jgi:hypothetical protein
MCILRQVTVQVTILLEIMQKFPLLSTLT